MGLPGGRFQGPNELNGCLGRAHLPRAKVSTGFVLPPLSPHLCGGQPEHQRLFLSGPGILMEAEGSMGWVQAPKPPWPEKWVWREGKPHVLGSPTWTRNILWVPKALGGHGQRQRLSFDRLGSWARLWQRIQPNDRLFDGLADFIPKARLKGRKSIVEDLRFR